MESAIPFMFEEWCRLPGQTVNRLALLNFAKHKASALKS